MIQWVAVAWLINSKVRNTVFKKEHKELQNRKIKISEITIIQPLVPGSYCIWIQFVVSIINFSLPAKCKNK